MWIQPAATRRAFFVQNFLIRLISFGNMGSDREKKEMTTLSEAVSRAAEWIQEADGLLVTAGAGMGIDSGLPDFRGAQGFWQAYPALGRQRVAFEEIANPANFLRDPRLAWGFYGHRLNLYRSTKPHDGFGLLQDMSRNMPRGMFVFTSNVDGQFQKSGIDQGRVAECHGSIHHLQCRDDCRNEIWSADGFVPEVDEAECRLLSGFPRCPHCGELARPAILMFGDGYWNSKRSDAQRHRLDAWLSGTNRLVVIELGAGTAIPTVRWFGESLGCPMIRINPREPNLRAVRGVEMPVGALEGLLAISEALGI